MEDMCIDRNYASKQNKFDKFVDQLSEVKEKQAALKNKMQTGK